MNTSSSQIHRSWKIALAAAIVMVVLAVIGVGLTTSDRAIASTYWMVLVPVYGVLCVGVAWLRSSRGEGGIGQVVRQVVHWLAIAAAVWLDFFIRRAGEETGVAAGLTALLLLALGCFLAGVYFERLFAVVGLMLVATLLAVVRADQFLWPIVIVSVIAVVAMIWVMRRFAKSDDRKAQSSQSAPVGS